MSINKRTRRPLCYSFVIASLWIIMSLDSLLLVKSLRSSSTPLSVWKPRPIPTSPLIIGYAHNATSGKVVNAIHDGVNVVCWSFLNLVFQNNKPSIATDLNLEAIKKIRNQYPEILHIAAFGGWNGPHPPSGVNGKDWCDVFVHFNQQHNYLFDGIDWDLEGHDDRSAPTSSFTLETLDVMADFSRHAKLVHNLVVSMAPAESYLDIANDEESRTFSQRLNLPPLAWMKNAEDHAVVEKAGFQHAGKQCYAFILHKAGIDSFDWVSIQLYEAYSRYLHETTRQGMLATDAMLQRAEVFRSGYTVTNMPQYGSVMVRVPLNKLVIGVANGWADGVKFVKVDPNDLAEMQTILQDKYGEGVRGAMFWTIDEEGAGDVFMSQGLSNALGGLSSPDGVSTERASHEL